MTQTTLTRTMQPIIDAIGFEAAQALVKTYGGTRVYLPMEPRGLDDLVLCVGLAHSRALVAAVGSGPLEVPKCDGYLRARRNEAIEILSEAGVPQAEIARRFNLTERTIRNVLRDAEADDLMPLPCTTSESTA